MEVEMPSPPDGAAVVDDPVVANGTADAQEGAEEGSNGVEQPYQGKVSVGKGTKDKTLMMPFIYLCIGAISST